MANTRGFEVVAQVSVDVLRQIYRDAWKNGGDSSGEGVLPQRIPLSAGLAFGPYEVQDGEVVIPEEGLGLDMDVAINGVAARMALQVSVQIANPPIPSASLFNMDVDLTIRAPVDVLDPAINKVGLRLTGLPADAIDAAITSGDPVGPIANEAVAEYVHALYADETSIFPRRIEEVPLAVTPFQMKADMEIFDDSSDPAKRIRVEGPAAGRIILKMPCRIRFYDIQGEAYGVSLQSPMAVDAIITLTADYETPPGEVIARVATADVTLDDIVPAPGSEGENYTANRNLIALHPAHDAGTLPNAIKTGFEGLAKTRLRAIGDIHIFVPTLDDIEQFIEDQVRAELETRNGIAVWVPEAPEGSDVTIVDVTPKALSDALALCLNAGPGANADAMTNLIPAGRDFCVAISATKVNAAIADAITDEFPGGFPHRYNDIEGHDADLTSLTITLRDDDRIRLSGNVTVIDAICKTDVDADFTAHVDLRWEDASGDGQRIVPFQEGEPDIDLPVWVWIVGFLVGFILLGIIGVVIVAVVLSIADDIAESVGSRVIDEEAGSQFQSISAWPQTLDGIGTISARFEESVDIDTGGILSYGNMLITATFELTSVDQALSKGPYLAAGGAPINLDGGFDKPSSMADWRFGDGATAFERRPVHTYGKSGLYVAKLRVAVQEAGGATTRHFAAVQVANVPPSVTAPAAIEVDEGETFELVANFTDPEWLDRHTAIFDFGDNSKPVYTGVVETNTPTRAQGTARTSHAYCRSGTFQIVARILDDDGGIGQAMVTARVRNVAPTVHLPERVRTLVDQPLRLIGRFTDPGWCDRHDAIWAFGDCSEQWAVVREIHAPPRGRGTAEASHIYRCCGVHVARLTVRDEDGGIGTGEMRIEAVRLVNPRFEEGFHLRRDGREDNLVANGWAPFAAPWPMVDPDLAGAAQDAVFRPDILVVADGQRGQTVTARGAMIAGILQRVPVNRGWLYELEGRYDLPEGEGAVAMLGLDPSGGTDPLSPAIVWAMGVSGHDWASLAERAEALDHEITLFVGLRTTSPNTATIRWDSTQLTQVQPLCLEDGCASTRVDVGELADRRQLDGPATLQGVTFEPVKSPIPIRSVGQSAETALCFGRPGLVVTAPESVEEMDLEIHAETGLNIEISVYTSEGLARQTVESLPPGTSELTVRQDGLIRVALRATAPGACLLAVSLCLPEVETPEEPQRLCVDFRALTADFATSEAFAVQGMTFAPLGPSSLRVIFWGDPQGVQKLGFERVGVRVEFPFAAARAVLAVMAYGGGQGLTIDAFAGATLLSTTTRPATNGPATVTLEGDGMTALEIRGGDNEAGLIALCIDTRVREEMKPILETGLRARSTFVGSALSSSASLSAVRSGASRVTRSPGRGRQ